MVQGIYELNFKAASQQPPHPVISSCLRVRSPRSDIHHIAGILPALDVDKQEDNSQHQTNAADDYVRDSQERILSTQ